MAEKKPKRWKKNLFYIPKYEKVSDKSLSRIMLSSVFGMLICGICLLGLTWAWFSSDVTSNYNSITSANFTANIKVTKVGDEAPLSPTVQNGKYTYSLSADTEYSVVITASGNAEKYGGYCSVTYLREKPYHTVRLYPGNNEDKIHSVTFTVSASDNSSLIIVPQWGTYAKPDDEVLIGNSEDEINTLPLLSLSLSEAETEETTKTEEPPAYQLTESEQSYTVRPGDTLYSIAKMYGTTTAVLSAYNDIKNANIIYVGTIIKIPPADYKVPQTDTTQEASTESLVSEPSETEAPEQTDETSSAETSSIETSSVETSSVETSSVETSSAETSSIETSSVETSSVETSSVETSSAETSSIETSSVETSSVETSSVETSSVEASSVETSSVETSSVETSSVETSSIVSTEPSLQETEPEITNASETQLVPDADTTAAETDEP